MSTALHDSRYSWTRLGITLLIATIGNVGMWAIVVILPAVQAEFAVDRADASLYVDDGWLCAWQLLDWTGG
jgi:hypothetical protein